MRTPPASVLKSNRKLSNFSGLPKEGTKLREVYDFFKNNKGKIVDYSFSGVSKSGILRQLTDFYGCDIRCLKDKRWLFAGEWVGNRYVSYFEPTEEVAE